MMERLLSKRNLISFGLFVLFFHSVLILLPYFFNVANWIYIMDYIFLGLAGFAGVYYAAYKQIPIRFQPAQMTLIVFVCWYIISCLSMTITYNNDWTTHNNTGLLYTAIKTLFVFPLGYVMVREKEYSVGKILLHIFLLVWTVFISYVLIRIFQRETIFTPNGGAIIMQYQSLYLNCNRNTTGAWEMMFFLASCFMVLRCKKLTIKVLYCISSMIHYIALTMSNSRVCFLSTFVGFMLFVGIGIYLWLKKKNNPHSILIAIISALIAGAIFYYLSGLIFNIYNATSGSNASNRVGQDKTLSGREDVWRAAIAGLFSSVRCAVFGITPASTPLLIEKMSNGVLQNLYTHNEFLEVAVGIGIPGLCIFLVWFYMMMRDSYKLFFVQKDKTLFLVVPVIIICFMLANMMESYLVFYDYINGYVFFLLCGMLYGRVNKPLEVKQLSRQAIRNKQRKKKK